VPASQSKIAFEVADFADSKAWRGGFLHWRRGRALQLQARSCSVPRNWRHRR